MKRVAAILAVLLGCGGHPGVAPELAILRHPAKPMGRLEIDLEVPQAHSRAVERVALSPDGRFAATAAGDELMLWGVRSGQGLGTLSGHHAVVGAAFTAAGDRLISADSDGQILVWQVPSGRRLATLPGSGSFQDVVLALDIDPAGRTALLGRSSGQAELWDLASGRRLASYGPHESRVTGVALSPAGDQVLTGTERGALRLWSAGGQLQAIVQPPLGQDHAAEHLSFHGSDPVALAAIGNRVVDAWHLPTAAEIGWIAGPEPERDWVPPSRTRALRFAPDGRTVWAWVELEKPDPGVMERTHSVGVLAAWDLDTVGSLPAPGEALKSARASFMVGGGQGFAGAISADASRAMAVYEGQARVWDLATGTALQSFAVGDAEAANLAALLPDGSAALVSSDRGLALWDFAQARATARLGGDSLSVAHTLAVCPRGDRAVAAAAAVEVWDLRKGQRLALFQDDDAAALALSPDCSRLAAADSGGALHVWDVATRQQIAQGHLDTGSGPGALTWAGGGAVLVAAGRKLWRWDLHADPTAVGAVPETTLALGAGGRLGVARDGARVKVWEVATGKTLRSLRDADRGIRAASFSGDGLELLTTSGTGTLRLWNLSSDDSLGLRLHGDDWVMFSPDGYFDASEDGAALVSVASGGQRYAIQQFALQNNRPDILLGRFGLGTPALLSELRAQVARRFRKAGVTERALTADLHVPAVRIVSARARGDQGVLEVELTDPQVELASYQVLVGGVPVAAGPAAGHVTRRTLRVTLGAGANPIEVSATNRLGFASLRAGTTLAYAPTAPRLPDLYVLSFGVSHYRDPRLDLGFAAKDAHDLASALGAMRGHGFREVHVHTFLDHQVTAAAIQHAKALLAGAQVDDTIVLFLAGHGVHERTREARYYFATWEVDPRHLAATAASFESIEDLLYGVAPRRKLFLLDTCESGDLDPEELAGAVARAGSRGLTPRTSRGLDLVDDRPRAVARPAFVARDRFVFRDLSLRSGAVVLSSSRGGELSYESARIGNGYFTHAVLAALRGRAADGDEDGRISTSELEHFVTAAVARDTAGLQHPTIDRDNLDAKILLPALP